MVEARRLLSQEDCALQINNIVFMGMVSESGPDLAPGPQLGRPVANAPTSVIDCHHRLCCAPQGEPLHNYDPVIAAIDILAEGLALSRNKIIVSSVGAVMIGLLNNRGTQRGGRSLRLLLPRKKAGVSFQYHDIKSVGVSHSPA